MCLFKGASIPGGLSPGVLIRGYKVLYLTAHKNTMMHNYNEMFHFQQNTTVQEF